MNRFILGLGAACLIAASMPAASHAAENYFQGWEVLGSPEGWVGGTISGVVQQVPAGGNPGGHLRCIRINNAFPEFGATTTLAAVSGDYAAAGAFEVSFDLRFEPFDGDGAVLGEPPPSNFTDAVFRVRYRDASFNGWTRRITNSFPVGIWRTFAIRFDPTWSDAEAVGHGWIQEAGAVSFAQTMSDVFQPEIRVTAFAPTRAAESTDGFNGPVFSIDNFRLRVCGDRTLLLHASFDGDTPGQAPNLGLPGPPAGDVLALNEASGTVRVAAAVGTLTDKPIVLNQVPGIGGLDALFRPAPHEDCSLVRVSWSSLAASNDIVFLACALRDASGLILAALEYRPNGEMTYAYGDGARSTVPVAYTPNVHQRFDVLVDPVARTTSLSIDGTAVPGFQNRPYYQLSAGDFARLGFEGGGTGAQVFAFDDVAAVGCDCACTDNAPPTLEVVASPNELWPPNHKLVEVCVETRVADDCDPAPVVRFLSVTSNEPDNGRGDGNTSGDIVLDDEDCFLLRAERRGGGDGRIYTITYCATDAAGRETCSSTTVTVPHDQSGHANGSTGFAANGAGLLAGAREFSLWIPASATFASARVVDRSAILIGNHSGVVAPTRIDEVDLEGDGDVDLRVTFDADMLDKLQRTATGEPQAVAMRYLDRSGEGYLVPDIFALGAPLIPVVVMPGMDPTVEPGTLSGTGITVQPARPNPFTSTTRIEYVVGGVAEAPVEIGVYDVTGRQVRSLFQGTRSAGTWSATWDGRSDGGAPAAAGVYFAKVVVAGQQTLMKVQLLR